MSCTNEVGINNLYAHYFKSYFCVIFLFQSVTAVVVVMGFYSTFIY